MRAMNPPRATTVDLDQLTPDEMAGLTEREFRLVVNADLRKDASNERVRGHVPPWITEALRGPHAPRRLAVLRAMLANVEGQIEMKTNAYELAKAEAPNDPAVTAEHHRELTGPLRFRAALLEAMPEAEYLVSNRIDELERAIRAHRQAIEADDTLVPSTADEALWAMIFERP